METGMKTVIMSFFILSLTGLTEALQKENIHRDCGVVNKNDLLKPLSPVKCSHNVQQSIISDSRNVIIGTYAIEKSFDRHNIQKWEFSNQLLSNEKYTLATRINFEQGNNALINASQSSACLLFYEASLFKHPSKSDFMSPNTLFHTPINYNSKSKYSFPSKPEGVEYEKDLQPSVSYYDTPLNYNSASKYNLPSKSEGVEYRKDLLLQPLAGYYDITINTNSASKYVFSSKLEGIEYEMDLLLQPSIGDCDTSINSNSASKYALAWEPGRIEYGKDLLLQPSVGYYCPINSNSTSKYVFSSKIEGLEYGKDLLLHPSVGYEDIILSNNLPICNITDIPHFTAPLSFMSSFTHSNTPISNMFELQSSMISSISFSSFSDIASNAVSTSEMLMSGSSGHPYTSMDQEDSTNLWPSTSSGRIYRSSVVTSLSESESGYAVSRFLSSSIFNDSYTSGGYNSTNTTNEYP